MKSIYLDYNATTPVDERVFNKMLPFFQHDFGNASSIAHNYGWTAEKAVQNARNQVAQLLECQSKEIIFTSGATESNNWVVRGLIEEFRKDSPQEPIHFITSPVEHSSITNAFRWAARQPGVEVSWAPVNSFGQVSVESVEKLIKPSTKLMSFMWINNEIGSINPIPELCKLAKQKQIYFHSDATQAVGKTPISLKDISVDLLSFSGHKIYGPKGIGALYIRSQNPHVAISPMLLGGGHERGLRAGTVNVPGVVGLGEACALAKEKMPTESARLQKLRLQFEQKLKLAFPDCQINGHPTERGPSTTNVTFRNRQVPAQFSGIAVSRGSACMSGSVAISQVLTAIGISEHDAQNTMRISIGSATTETDLEETLAILNKHLTQKSEVQLS